MFKSRSLRSFGKVRLIRNNGFGQNQLHDATEGGGQRHAYASTENQINPKTLTGSVADNLICQLLMATSYLFVPKMGSRWDLICSRIDLEKVLFSLFSLLVGILWVEKLKGEQKMCVIQALNLLA